jgi:hypothetical protein
VNYLDLLADEYLSKKWERAVYSRERGGAVDYPVWQMVDFDSVRKISNASPVGIGIGVCDYNHLVASVYQFLRSRLEVCFVLKETSRPPASTNKR